MSLVLVTAFTEEFNVADTLDIGSNWDHGYSGEGACQIVSNRVVVTAPDQTCSETVNSISLPGDQFAEMVLSAFTTSGGFNAAYVLLRAANPTTATWYEFTAALNAGTYTSRIMYRLAGSGTATVATENATTWTSTDTLRAEANDTSLRLYRNGGLLVSLTDGTLTGGRCGLRIHDEGGNEVQVDSFKAGYWLMPGNPVRRQAVPRAANY